MKLLFFKAPWCTACHAIEDTVPDYCIHIDCDEDQETPVKYSVVGLPVFIAVDDNGQEVGRLQSTNVKIIDHWYKGLQDGSE